MTDSEISILLIDQAPAVEMVQGPYRPGKPMAFVELPDRDRAIKFGLRILTAFGIDPESISGIDLEMLQEIVVDEVKKLSVTE